MQLPLNIKYAHSVNVGSIIVLLQNFPLTLPFALLFFHLAMFCTHHFPCYEYQGADNMPDSLCQGSCSMIYFPLTPGTCPKHVWHGPKTSLEILEWKKWGKGQTGGKNCSIILVLSALITTGICNIKEGNEVMQFCMTIVFFGGQDFGKILTWKIWFWPIQRIFHEKNDPNSPHSKKKNLKILIAIFL